MAIFINESSRVIAQGMTGREGRKHTQRMIMSGTRIVGHLGRRLAAAGAARW